MSPLLRRLGNKDVLDFFRRSSMFLKEWVSLISFISNLTPIYLLVFAHLILGQDNFYVRLLEKTVKCQDSTPVNFLPFELDLAVLEALHESIRLCLNFSAVSPLKVILMTIVSSMSLMLGLLDV
jgi:hypothetical protein